MNLFRLGNFTLASGKQAQWKIDCNTLLQEDCDALALMAVEFLKPFGRVEGVPTGGVLFAKALEKYKTKGGLLIAEDVITTGNSMEKYRNNREAQGIVVFNRGEIPSWAFALFTMLNSS